MLFILERTIQYLLLSVVFLFPAYLLRYEFFGIPTTLVELLIYSVFLLWMLSLLLDKEKRERISNRLKELLSDNKMLVFGLFLLLVGAFSSSLLSVDQLMSLGLLKAYFIDPIIFLFLFAVLFSSRNVDRAINVFLASGVFLALLALLYFFSGDVTYDGRLQAVFNSPNFLAMSLAPVILVSFWNLLFRKVDIPLKLVSTAALFVLLPAFFLSRSYGAFFALFTAIFLMLFMSGRSAAFKTVIALLLLSLSALILFFNLDAKKTSDLLQGDERSSFRSREMIWSASEMILKENYLLGIGPGMFQAQYLFHQKDFDEPYLEWAVPYPHNLFLAFWIQLGLAGFLGFVLLLFWVFAEAYKGIRKNKNEFMLLAAAFFVYFILHGLVDTPYWKNDLSLTFFFFLAIVLLAKKRERLAD